MVIKIRCATLLDLPSIFDLAKSVGRFLSADEIRTWLQVDPEALFVAETSQNGKIIGSCCGIRLSQELGFMGLYVVLEEYRGRGLGLKLWKAAKEHLGDRNIGVHGNPTTFKMYTEKAGFCHIEDYVIQLYVCFGNFLPTNIILPSDIEVATYFEGNFIGCSKKLCNDTCSLDEYKTHNGSNKTEGGSKINFAEENIFTNVKCFEKSSLTKEQHNVGKVTGIEHVHEYLPSNVTISNASTHAEQGEISNNDYHLKSDTDIRKDLDEFEDISLNSISLTAEDKSKSEEILSGVIDFDKSLLKRDRSFLVRQTFSWTSCRSKVALLKGKVVGYACLRHILTEDWIISPFYADTEDIAEILLFDLLQGFDFSLAPKGIWIRFPDKNTSCKRLVEKFGFMEGTLRVLTGFTKQCLRIDTSKIYSFHSTVYCSE